MIDGLALTDSCSVVVTRAALLTTTEPIVVREPEDLPPVNVVGNGHDEEEPCALLRKRGAA